MEAIGLSWHLKLTMAIKDKEVDGGLPLDDIMKPDPELREMLTGLKMKKWIFTNAYYPVSDHWDVDNPLLTNHWVFIARLAVCKAFGHR